MDGEKQPRKRRSKEEIEAEKAAKQAAREERERAQAEKRAAREAEKAERDRIRAEKAAAREAEKAERDRIRAEKAEERRKRNGPWSVDELREQALDWKRSLPRNKDVMNRWERAYSIEILQNEVNEYGVAEVCGSHGDVYQTSLRGCSCPDNRFRGNRCKHQMALVMLLTDDTSEPFDFEEYRAMIRRSEEQLAEMRRKDREEMEAYTAQLEKEARHKQNISTARGCLWIVVIIAAIVALLYWLIH